MLKKDIRKLYKTLRNNISENEKLKLEDLILIQFQKIGFDNCSNLLSYAPILDNNEYNPILMEDYFLMINQNAQLHYPIVNVENNMDAVLVNEHTVFEQKSFGIYEPINSEITNPLDIDVIILPLLAFNKQGYRVGYGKGFYDKFVLNCKPQVLKIGVSFFDAVDIDDVNEWDIPLNHCITPNKIYNF